METKSVRIYLKTWKKLRRLIPRRTEETVAEYMGRIVEVLNDRIGAMRMQE